jgi:hypothetical protein
MHPAGSSTQTNVAAKKAVFRNISQPFDPLKSRQAYSLLPSEGDELTLALERFRFKCCHLKTVRGGIFLRKLPLGIEVSVQSRIETAVAASGILHES